ncbi:hypothetical protein [Actinoplanes sp. NPDC051859]|uniref:hypothetical protein n=1 Tax=Actinoplanes sp. NPDC051859 TaxID=3363909 RepID=UPI0037A6D3FC
MERPYRWPLVAAMILAAAQTAGCTDDDVIGADPVPAAPTGGTLGELRQQAAAVLAHHDATTDSSPPASSAPSWSSANGHSITSARGAPGSTRLTVTFTGTKGPATEPCGADYYAESVESATAVVVVLMAQPHSYGELCTLQGFTRTADLNLARPLGQRVVLEIREGQAVQVEPALFTD